MSRTVNPGLGICLVGAILALGLVRLSVTSAQGFRTDWSVVDVGGGAMSSSGFVSLSSIGQTATGYLRSPGYQALLGFWQIDTAHVGVNHDITKVDFEPLTTRLYAPIPNPNLGSGKVKIHYSLAQGGDVRLCVLDIVGREVARLVDGWQGPGVHTTYLLATDQEPTGCHVRPGVYFLSFRTADCQEVQKLILGR